jgi:hypothetical protein
VENELNEVKGSYEQLQTKLSEERNFSKSQTTTLNEYVLKMQKEL